MENSIKHLLPSYSNTEPIYTSRLILRPFRWTDIQTLYKLRTAPEVMQWTSQKTIDSSEEQTRRWMSNFIDDDNGDEPVPRRNFNFVVTLHADESNGSTTPELIGVCGLTGLDSLPVSPLPSFGYMFVPEAWGKGYATEAALAFQGEWRRLISLAQQTHSFPAESMVDFYKLRAVTLESNAGSARVLQKCGWAAYEHADVEDEKLVRWILDTSVTNA